MSEKARKVIYEDMVSKLKPHLRGANCYPQPRTSRDEWYYGYHCGAIEGICEIAHGMGYDDLPLLERARVEVEGEDAEAEALSARGQ